MTHASNRSFTSIAVLAATGSFLNVACDPGFVMTGFVTTADRKPISGASVGLRCNGADQGGTALTRADGSFSDNRIGWHSDSCVAAIRAPGFQPRDVVIGPHCVARPSRLKDACLNVQFTVALIPLPPTAR